MDNYLPFPSLLSEDIIHHAEKFGSALLADGMKGLGIKNEGCMDASMLPIDEHTKLVGTAITVETQDGDNFPIHVAVYQGKPGYVLVVDGKGFVECSYMGDLIGGAAQAVGYNGIVVDGLVRDRLSLKEMGFPVFSKGYIQRGPSKIGPGKINHAISCAGVDVQPGDLVVGDADGVTIVPKDRIEEVFAAAEKKLDYEIKRKITIDEYCAMTKAGKPAPQLAPQWVEDMLSKKNPV